jgi:hypothetical protein
MRKTTNEKKKKKKKRKKERKGKIKNKWLPRKKKLR